MPFDEEAVGTESPGQGDEQVDESDHAERREPDAVAPAASVTFDLASQELVLERHADLRRGQLEQLDVLDGAI